MRKLIHFLVRYFTAILFLLLQGVALLLIINSQSYQKSVSRATANEWSGSVLSYYSSVDEYFNLASTNKMLARENANLRATNKAAYFSLVARRDSVVDSLYQQQYTFLEARVINSSFRKRNNYITLNRGSLHGIKPDMAVTSASGIVGIVKRVSPHFSSVLPIIHSRSLISAGFEKDDHFGSMSWDGEDYRVAQIYDVPRETKIAPGDTIITDVRSHIFPRNLMIGTIQDFELNHADQTYTINVKLSVDFAQINYVYVIDNFMKLEQQQIEQEQDEE